MTALRMRRMTMLTAVIAIAPLSVLGVVLTADSWREGLIVSIGLLLTIGIVRQWSLDGYPVKAVMALAFTAVAWLSSALTISGPLGFVPLALVGSLLLARVERRRLLATIAFAATVAAVGATTLIPRSPTWLLVELYVLLPVAGTLFIMGVITASESSWKLVRRLERAQDTETELAIAKERVRFAGDLHDIQGHTLHVIKFKAALVQNLVSVDPERAGTELKDIRRMIDETIQRTKELAYARHELDFMTEIENARRLCEAVGITVHVTVDAGVPRVAGGVHPLLAHVLREGTTNLLRHARPTWVSIVATPDRVEVANDGAQVVDELELRGLARLRARIELAGGDLHIQMGRGEFRLLGSMRDGSEGRVGRGVALPTPSEATP